jgi:multidrug transporter EmrE-like cation transporter
MCRPEPLLRECRPALSDKQMPPERKMTTQVVLLVLGSALLTACANLMMRNGLVLAGGLGMQGDGVPGLVLRLAKQWTFVLGLVAYALAAVVWFRVLSVAEVSTSYPILVGLTFVMVSVGAVFWFRESVSFLKVVGIVVILAGIVLVAKA